jgi:hypothetical protein
MSVSSVGASAPQPPAPAKAEPYWKGKKAEPSYAKSEPYWKAPSAKPSPHKVDMKV